MKVDKLLSTKLNKRERFFLNCWCDMVNSQSLDSYRLRIMNPCNITQELITQLNGEHKSIEYTNLIYEEFKIILSLDDIVKNHPNYYELGKNIQKEYDTLNKDKNLFSKKNKLLLSLLNELYLSLYQTYHILSIDWFIDNLSSDDIHDEILDKINIQTSNFLSFLIYKYNQDLGSLFVYYRNLFTNKNNGIITTKLKLLKRILTENLYRCVLFKITSSDVNFIDKFPLELLEEKQDIFFFRKENLSNVSTHLKKFNLPELNISDLSNIDDILDNKDIGIYALFISSSIDGKVAGNKAYRVINGLIDIVRFNVLSTPLKVCSKYAYIKDGKINTHHIDDKIPNFYSSENDQVLLNNLIISNRVGNLLNQDLQHLLLSLKYYRHGKDSDNLPDKIMNWWTALEHLTYSGTNDIGKNVVKNVSSVICKQYFFKHFYYIKQSSSFLEEKNILSTKLSTLSLEEIFRVINGEKISSISNSEYVNYCLEKIKKDIHCITSIKEKIIKYRSKIEMQLYRIYRARCSIVHSSTPIVDMLLLCADLELYFKSLFDTILCRFNENQYITTLEEFFLREKMHLDSLLSSTEIGSESLLKI